MASSLFSSWLFRVLAAALSCVASAAAVRVIVARTKPGLRRLQLCLPAAILYCAVPFLFEVQSISRASAAAMLLWLANFKLLALCLGRGPLTQPDLTLGQFTALLLWPIMPKTDAEGRVLKVEGGATRGSEALRRLFWRAPENLAVFVAGLFTLTHPAVPLFAKTYSAAFGVCAYCGLWANACAALVQWAHGLQVGPSWDRPWLQTSLADFWGRRWNLPTSASLKHLVYEPLVEGSLVARPKPPKTHDSTEGAQEAKEDAVSPPALAANGGGAEASAAESSSSTTCSSNTKKGTSSGSGSSRQLPSGTRGPAGTELAPGGPLGEENTSSGAAVETPGETHGSSGVAPTKEDAADAVTTTAAVPSPSPLSPPPQQQQQPNSAERGIKRSGGRRAVPASIRLLSLVATFAVSGVMHEVLLCACTGDTAQLGKQALFFAIQAPLMLAEQYLVKALTRARVHLPTWLCIPVASLTLQIPAMYWFWGAYFAAVRPRASPLAPTPPPPNATVDMAAGFPGIKSEL